jgi:hypothetical protein
VRAGFYTEWVAGINYVVEGLNKVGPFVLSDGESYQYAFKGLEDYGNLTLSTLNHEALANDSTVNCLLANIGVPTSFIGKYAAQRNNKLVMGTSKICEKIGEYFILSLMACFHVACLQERLLVI